MSMNVERTPQGEVLTQKQKIYLREVHRILRLQGFCLSAGGMNLGRTGLGVVNELGRDLIRMLVDDDTFLYDETDEFFPEGSWSIYKYWLEVGRQEMPRVDVLANSKQMDLLTKYCVLLEWGWDVARTDNGQGSHENSPIGLAVKVVKDMLVELVNKEEVEERYAQIKDNSQGIEISVRMLGWM